MIPQAEVSVKQKPPHRYDPAGRLGDLLRIHCSNQAAVEAAATEDAASDAASEETASLEAASEDAASEEAASLEAASEDADTEATEDAADSAVEEAAVEEEEPPQAVIPTARTRAATATPTFLSFIFKNLLISLCAFAEPLTGGGFLQGDILVRFTEKSRGFLAKITFAKEILPISYKFPLKVDEILAGWSFSGFCEIC